MNNIIYIQSLHRPYNQNLNSVKWVCKFIENKNSKNEISKSDLYVDFYIYIIRKFYNHYKKFNLDYITHGIPTFESIQKSYIYLKGHKREKQRELINKSIALRETEVDRSIFSTYKASSYFINLAKTKLAFVDTNNTLNESGVFLNTLRSNDFKLSNKEKEILFSSIIKKDFHFFISLALLKKIERKVKNLNIEEIHYDFLVDKYNIRHFKFTEASQLNFSKIRDYWLKDLDILDKNLNIKKIYLDILFKNDFEKEVNKIQKEVNNYYKEKIISKSKYQKTVNLFIDAYLQSSKNELGFISLSEIAEKMNLNKTSFQNFISKFYELEKGKYNIFFNNLVQSISGKNQYFIRNRPVVNIRIKELNK